MTQVQARVTTDEVQDQKRASYAYELLLERLASLAGKNPAPPENNYARKLFQRARQSQSSFTPHPPQKGVLSMQFNTRIDRMKTRLGESPFLKADVGGETACVFGRPEELAERLEASGYDIPASEIEVGLELHLPCAVKVGQGNNGYKTIEKFLRPPTIPSQRDESLSDSDSLLNPPWTNTLAAKSGGSP